ncbi:MAG: acetyl-CoA hydrolase/transferase C-terminal domain-containing protein [Coxiellaceae bacterium]|nr:acetyl-CoA hydrolase/transferase C-terminal domain-containing protein [Coxiellaceae bacterium]
MTVDRYYQSKLMSAEQAVEKIADHSRCCMSHGISQPPAILKALADRARARALTDLSVYYVHSEKAAAETILADDLVGVFHPVAGFYAAAEKRLRQLDKEQGRRVVNFTPNTLSQYPRLLCDHIKPDSFISMVSPMDEAGYFSLGTSPDYGRMASRIAPTVIVEVNKHMPRTFGDTKIHVTDVAAIVENDDPLQQLIAREPTEAEFTIAKLIAEQINDGDTLQLAASGVSKAVCQCLHNHQDLGLHSELLSSGLIPLMKSGVLNGRRKNIHTHKHLFTLSFGDEAMYEYMDLNPTIEGYGAEYINSPEVIARNHNMFSINSAVEIDLFGQTSAESMGWRQYSGAGGQNDFVRGAYESQGGRSVLAFSSTAKNGTVSRIVPKVNGAVTNNRMDVDWVVTEYGKVQMKGLTTYERAKALIDLAHPDYRESLHNAAVEQHIFV